MNLVAPIRSHPLLPVILMLACTSASKQGPPTDTPAAALASSVVPGLRLRSPVVVPLHYRATLSLNPSSPSFSGRLEARVKVERASQDFFLNGHGLRVTSAKLVVGDQQVALRVDAEGEEWLHFQAPKTLPVGIAVLEVVYEGEVSHDSSFGLFAQKAGGDWYLFSQFEARGARRAFPSFDQPDLKVPWQLSLEVPENLVALTNTPEVHRQPLPGGRVRVDFAESKPLPSYLVALAVGPFDMVNIGKTRSGVPVRVAAPRGRGGETSWVVESTLPIIEILEDYTGIPYPYAKLDLVSIPATGSFGAMENAGLITYTETLLLSKDNDLDFRQRYASVGAHELSHQWFGDLVTNAWWDDLWLNESFATWSAAKVLSKFRPQWRSDLAWIERRESAMAADRLESARVIHQPIEVEADIGGAFDGITYAKGASVLTMFEGFLGEALFQKGIQHYLGNNQWKSLRAADFLAAMDAGTSRNISESFTTFLDHPGTPLITIGLRCVSGEVPVLTLEQERYKPLGSTISAAQRYQVPFCVRFPRGGKQAASQQCIMLSKKTTELRLDGASECPRWLIPNSGATGYYRSALSDELRDASLFEAPRSVPEQMVGASDLKALVWAGKAPLKALLQYASSMAKSDDDALVAAAAQLSQMGALITKDNLPRYQRWLSANFSKKAREIGWHSRAGEAPSRVELRGALLSLAIFEAGDETLRRDGQALAASWLEDPSSIDANIAGLALQVGARFGDVALLERYVSAIKATSDRSRRRMLLAGLGAVRTPALMARALQVMLDPDIDVRESQRMLSSLAGGRFTGYLALDFVESNFNLLAKRYGDEMGTRLARVARVQCDESRRESAETFLRERIAPMKGGERASKQALESIRLCLAARSELRLPYHL